MWCLICRQFHFLNRSDLNHLFLNRSIDLRIWYILSFFLLFIIVEKAPFLFLSPNLNFILLILFLSEDLLSDFFRLFRFEILHIQVLLGGIRIWCYYPPVEFDDYLQARNALVSVSFLVQAKRILKVEVRVDIHFLLFFFRVRVRYIGEVDNFHQLVGIQFFVTA